jgi:hypothetical protein
MLSSKNAANPCATPLKIASYEQSGGLYYDHITIKNNAPGVMMLKNCGTTDDSRSILYDHGIANFNPNYV